MVCTSNQCRSPMAAALLANELSASGVKAVIRSVGVHARVGASATAEAVAVMRERGLDISEHRSRLLDARHVRAADLVLGMAREHIRDAVVLDATALNRSFTLKELVHRAEGHPRRDAPLSAYMAALTSQRDVDELLGSSEAHDIADPIGQPVTEYRVTAQELEDLTHRLVRSVWRLG